MTLYGLIIRLTLNQHHVTVNTLTNKSSIVQKNLLFIIHFCYCFFLLLFFQILLIHTYLFCFVLLIFLFRNITGLYDQSKVVFILNSDELKNYSIYV